MQIFKEKGATTITTSVEKVLGQEHPKRSELFAKIFQAYTPTLEGFTLPLIVIFVIFLASRFSLFSRFNFLNLQINYVSVAGIYQGVTSFIFVFLIFIAEFLKNNSEKARALLKASWLYPITITSLALFFIILFVDKGTGRSGIIIAIAFTIAATIFALYKGIQLLLDPVKLQEQEIALISDLVKRNVTAIKKERIGNNYFFTLLEKDQYDIIFSPIRPQVEGYKAISLQKTGIIDEIDIKRLYELFEKLENIGEENGMTFKLKKKTELSFEETFQSLQNESAYDFYHPKSKSIQYKSAQGFITKTYKGTVADDRQQVLYIPSKIVEKAEDEKAIITLVNKTFLVKPDNDDISKQLHFILGKRKDEILEGIRNKSTITIEYVIEIYLGTIKAFLDIVTFKTDEARQVTNSFFDRWNPLEWATKDIESMIKEAIHTEDVDIINEITPIVYISIIEAIRHKDHLIMQKFLNFYGYIYYQVKQIGNKELNKSLIREVYLNINEIAQLNLDITDPLKTIDDLLNYKDFYAEILRAYLQLLKLSFDLLDLENFKNFLGSLQEVDRNYHVVDDYDIERYKLQLANEDISENDREEITNKLEKKRISTEIRKSIIDERNVLTFGLASWVLKKTLGEDIERLVQKDFWDSLISYLPTSLNNLLKTFVQATELRAEEYWGWIWWGTKENQIFTSDSMQENIKLLLCIRALQLIKDNTIKIDEVETNTDMPGLIYTIEAEILPLISSLKSNLETVEKVIPDATEEDIEKLSKLFSKILQKLKEREEKRKEMAKVKEEKILQFKKEIKETYYENEFFKDLFILRKLFTKKEKNKGEKLFFGKYEIIEKDPFTDDIYQNTGRIYGEFLANAENNYIFKEVKESIPFIQDNDLPLEENIVDMIEKLKQNEFKPNIIVFSFYPVRWFRQDLIKGEFEPKKVEQNGERPINKQYLGEFLWNRQRFPVYYLNTYPPERTVLLADLEKLAEYIQYEPYHNEKEKKDSYDIFYIQVRDLSTDNELRDQLLEQNPQWLEAIENKEAYLKQKVAVRIYERFKLKLKSSKAGLRLSVKNSQIH